MRQGSTYRRLRPASVGGGCQGPVRAAGGEHAARSCTGGQFPGRGRCGCTRSCAGKRQVRDEGAAGPGPSQLGSESRAHSVRVSWACPKARSVNSSTRCAPKSTGQERSSPPRSRHSRTLPWPHEAILPGGKRTLWTVPGPGSAPVWAPGLPTTHPSRVGAGQSPGFIEKGNLKCLDVDTGVRFSEKDGLTASPHLLCAPGHHHLRGAHTEWPHPYPPGLPPRLSSPFFPHKSA